MSDQSPASMDTTPSHAGIYDYMLGGTHYSEADREAAEKALAIAPGTRLAAIENRAFLKRAVRYVAGHGVGQYIDIGSGFPAAGPVHEVAAEIIPDPHVLYVDRDPRVTAVSREVIRSPNVATVAHDIRDPWDIIDDPETARIIDWSRPVAVLMVAILHFVSDEADPGEIIAVFRDHMVSGSYLVLSHGSLGDSPDTAEEAARAWNGTRSPVVFRTPSEIERLFSGFEMVDPGLVTTREWGTDASAPVAPGVVLAGVGRSVEPPPFR
ncbi:MAG TPA: SAM-dependent methyltransferase [Streptosporangiaceae bacterium]